MAFKVGDVVMLKSGGAVMTVGQIGDADGAVLCSWHNEISPKNYASVDHAYRAEMLELLSDVVSRQKSEVDEAEQEAVEEIDEP